MKKVLIIGGGFAGCSAAHMFGERNGWDVTLIEGGRELGAGVRTRFLGGHPYTFGPRHFLTQDEEAYRYLTGCLELRNCGEHEFKTYVNSDRSFYNYPIHMDDIKTMEDSEQIMAELESCDYFNRQVRFDPAGQPIGDGKGIDATNLEEFWIKSVGPTLYKKFVKSYNQKMWLVNSNEEIDIFGWSPKGVAIKDGPKASWDDAYSGYPVAEDGYNQYFDMATQNTTVIFEVDARKCVNIEKRTLKYEGNTIEFDMIINTISIDLLFDMTYGELPYVGRDMEFIIIPTEEVLPGNVYFAYYAGDEKYTRITEYKKLTRQMRGTNTSLISIEYPSRSGRHYPVPMKKYRKLYQRYVSDLPNNVHSIGRAGSYDYGVDIDDCIIQAQRIIRSL